MTDFNQKTHDIDVGNHGGQSRQMTEVFENQEFGSIRVLQEAGKTFFCASNLAKALSDVAQVSTLLRRCSNNLNQYAKRANESGSIYAEDIRDLQKRLDELWEMQKLILKRLSGIR